MLACLHLGGRGVELLFQFLARICPLGCQHKLLQLYHNRISLWEMISLFVFHKYWLASPGRGWELSWQIRKPREYWNSKLHMSYGVFQVAKSNKTILLDLDVNRIPEEKRQLLDWDSGSNRESTGISKQGHSYCAVLIIN